MSIRGNGATFALSSGSVGTIVEIDPGEETLEDIEDDNLGVTDYHETIPALVATVGDTSITAIFDPDSVPALGTVLTGTLTYPPKTGQSNGATWIGTGYLKRRKVTQLTLDARVLVELTWHHDGKTGPAYSAGS